MNVNRDALEIVLQTGGEMFDLSIFNNSNLSPDISWPDQSIGQADQPLTKEKLEELSSLLINATRNIIQPHLGKKIGFTLSGGVDSSLLLYLMKKVYPDIEVTAYHTDWKFEGRSELQFAKMAADFVDVPLKVIDVSPEAQVPYIEEALAHSKIVAYSLVPVYMAHHAMKQDDITIAVNALGLDELFAGYTIHRRYYSRGKIHFVPHIPQLTPNRLYRGASLKWGGNKTFLLANSAPNYSTRFVESSSIDLSKIYEEKIRSSDLWLEIHRWILWAMKGNYANLISHPALANGVTVLFPYMDKELMEKTHEYGPLIKKNKAPIRALMRDFYRFPPELSQRGENWDKIGWGGTISPYLASKKYLNSITPQKTSPKEWFTTKGLKEYQTFPEKPSVRALHMAMFLKTLELV